MDDVLEVSLRAYRTNTITSSKGYRPTTVDKRFEQLPWYEWWIRSSLQNQLGRCESKEVIETVMGCSPSEECKSWDAKFLPIWDSVKEQIQAPGAKSIRSITAHLVEAGLLSVASDYKALWAAEALVFSLLGLHTMLFSADLAASLASDTYMIQDETDGHRGEAHLCLAQPTTRAREHGLADLLLHFGMALPLANYCAFDGPDEQRLFRQIRAVSPMDLDAHLLVRFCGVRFAWTTSLSCHLELDKSAKVLYLFRYPSFCLAHISHPLSSEEEAHRTPIHSCVFEPSQQKGMVWGAAEDVTGLLEEILLSYRLLFGQSKASRRLFLKELRPFAGVPTEGQDPLLTSLCGLKKLPKRWEVRGESAEYDLSEDFPHLRNRLVRLVGLTAEKKPRTLREMWFDKRDSASWMTFWTVLIIGSLGLLLSFVQTVLQILQYVAALEENAK